MLSRVADCAYWMGRYLERAEHTARLGDLILALTLDRSSDTARRLTETAGSSEVPYGPLGSAAHTSDRPAAELRPCIGVCVAAARENARQVREQVSTEMWEQLNRLYLYVRQDRSQAVASPPSEFYRYVKEASHLSQGVADSTMSHGEGWHYIQIGRLIERAATTATILEIYFRDPGTDEGPRDIGAYVEWAALLRSCSAFEAYCRCYTADIRPERVAEFLLLNGEFPRSVRFAVDGVEASLGAIARALGRSAPGRVDRLAGRLRASLDYSQIDEIMADSLQSYAQGIRKQCEQVHTSLYQTYITYSAESAIA
jgi:uncharacterized alpha-E superfamily protein